MCNFENSYRRMDYYTDRCTKNNFFEVANECAKGNLNLWDTYYLNSNEYKGNIFYYKFETDANLKHEYLFAMDCLTYALTAYKASEKDKYRQAFNKVVEQFHEYIKAEEAFYSELPIYAQTLLFIKALDFLGSIPHQKDFFLLLLKYADWLMDDKNYFFDNNHGLFEDLALLHLSVLFECHPESKLWQEHAVKRVNQLFEVAYYEDYTNNEHSISYFNFNNYLYEQIIKFCNYYNIGGIEKVEAGLAKSKKILSTFAHRDTSFPVIGDGQIFYSTERNQCSGLFPDVGIAIIKVDEVYLSFKCKTVFQSHAHTDISSVTARYKNIDLIIDSGQYNYDRYSPINRHLRSSAGHAGIFPIYADGLFQKDFCDSIEYAGIRKCDHNDDNAYVKGEYKLNDVKICREVSVLPNEIEIKDSWSCEIPTVIRQRFIIPKELIGHSKFIASINKLEAKIDDTKVSYEIISNQADTITQVNFGVAAPQYNNYEMTMLLDTIVENALSGEIIAKIRFGEEEE